MKIANLEFEKNLRQEADHINLYTPTEQQIETAERLIGDNLDRVREELSSHRRYADVLIRRNQNSLSPKDKMLLRQYPIGCCWYIRESVLRTIRLSALEEKDVPKESKSILTQVTEALRVKGVWGIQDEKYFQNGIQAGNYFLDTANDTVDPTQPKVVVSTIEQARFRDVKSVVDYLDISHRYNGCRFERNTAVPELSPLFPVLEVLDGRRIGILKVVKLIHPIPTPVMASAILRGGLEEFKDAYATNYTVNDDPTRIIDETVRAIGERLVQHFDIRPFPKPGSGMSITKSFSNASRAITSQQIHPEALTQLYDLIEQINEAITANSFH